MVTNRTSLLFLQSVVLSTPGVVLQSVCILYKNFPFIPFILFLVYFYNQYVFYTKTSLLFLERRVWLPRRKAGFDI